MEVDTSSDKFLHELSQKSYVDIFNVRSRLEQSEWERNAVTNLKDIIFKNENRHPKTKNVLYIHIPFCATRCKYCPYYTSYNNNSLKIDYMNALEKEIFKYKDTPFLKSTVFDSIYFGGGTPSVLSIEEIKRITYTLFNNFTFSDKGEFSFEANPSTLTKEKMIALKDSGINRVSLGIQTFDDNLLRDMQCAHTKEKAISVINSLLDYGFIVNIDMIYGLVGQTKENLEKDMEILNSFDVPHQVTLFPLRISAHTPLGQELNKQEGITVKSHNERLLELDAHLENIMVSNQYNREESPIFYYKSGSHPHRYNSTETRIVGFGSSAGTTLDEGETSNFYDVEEYISAINNNRSPALSGGPLTRQQAFERFVLYRIIYMNRSLPNFHEIVNKSFYEYFGIELGDVYFKVLDDLKRLRFIKHDSGKIVLTDRLWMILNKVKIGMPSIL